MKMCGTVSTIWGSPIAGATELKDAVEFTKRWLEIGASDIEHGYDVNRVLWLGRQIERTVGHRLRSEAVINGRTLKEGHPKFARPGLKKLKEKLGESSGQKVPAEWGKVAKLPEKYRAG